MHCPVIERKSLISLWERRGTLFRHYLWEGRGALSRHYLWEGRGTLSRHYLWEGRGTLLLVGGPGHYPNTSCGKGPAHCPDTTCGRVFTKLMSACWVLFNATYHYPYFHLDVWGACAMNLQSHSSCYSWPQAYGIDGARFAITACW